MLAFRCIQHNSTTHLSRPILHVHSTHVLSCVSSRVGKCFISTTATHKHNKRYPIHTSKNLVDSIVVNRNVKLGDKESKEESDGKEENKSNLEKVFHKLTIGKKIKKEKTEAPNSGLWKNVHTAGVPFPPLATSKAINEEFKISLMTEIQRLAIPAILQGGDVIAKSRTGSGKTLAFLIPAVEMVVQTLKNKDSSERRGTYVLIIVPTHELAVQTFKQARRLLRDHEFITVGVSMGGAELSNEIELFSKHPHILIVTPGRFAEHVFLRNMRARDFSSLKLLVFDEADRILDMGWKPEITRIMNALPENRQTVLFGATVSSESVGVSGIKSTALFLSASDQLTNEGCLQEFKLTNNSSIVHDLHHLLTQHKGKKTIVFFQTVRVAELMHHCVKSTKLYEDDNNIRMLHGRMDQRERSSVFDDFLNSKFNVMFSTNVAARGLDFPNVELIIQVGIPEDMEEYIHRIGRTARAGESGQAILLLRPYEKFFIQKLSGSKIQVKEIDFKAPSVEFTKEYEHLAQPAIVSYLGYLAGNKDFLGFLTTDVIREVKDFVEGMDIKRINVHPTVLEKLNLPIDSFRRKPKPPFSHAPPTAHHPRSTQPQFNSRSPRNNKNNQNKQEYFPTYDSPPTNTNKKKWS